MAENAGLRGILQRLIMCMDTKEPLTSIATTTVTRPSATVDATITWFTAVLDSAMRP